MPGLSICAVRCLVSCQPRFVWSCFMQRLKKLRLLTGLMLLLQGTFVEVTNASSPDPNDPNKGEAVKDDPSKPAALAETIIVSATRSERVAASLPLSTSVMEREEIEQTPALVPDDVLRNIPGLILPQLNSRQQIPSRNTVSMRGIADGVLILIDGVPANDPFRGSPQWTLLGMESIERVEVVRGANASLFGNYALGGTINIITRPAERSGIDLLWSYGSYGTEHLAARTSYVPHEGIGVSLSLERFGTNGYERTAREVRGPIDIPFWSHQDNGRLRIDLGTSPLRTTFSVGAVQNDLSQGTPLAGNSTELIDASNSGRMALGRKAALTWSAFFQNAQTSIRNVSTNESHTTEQRSHVSRSEGGSLGGSLQWSGSTNSKFPFISIGIDVRDMDGADAREEFTGGSRRGTIYSGGGTRLAGLFAEASWVPVETVEVMFSGRFDSWKNVDGYQQAIGAPRRFFPEREQTQFDPKVAVRKQLSTSSAIRGSVYRAFHAPEIDQLYRSGGTRLRPIVANPNLEPETMTGADLGFVFARTGAFVELNAFWNRVRQNIVRVPFEAGLPGALIEENVGASRSRGLEVFGSRSLGKRLSLDGGYTYTQSIVTEAPPSQPELQGNYSEDAPVHALTISAHYRPTDDIRVTMRGRYESESYPDIENALALDATTIINLRIAYRLSNRAELFAICENLFDRQYIAEINPDHRYGPPRHLHAGVRLQVTGHK